MRTWVYNILDNMSSLDAFDIISAGSAEDPDRPFLIISMGVESPPLGMPAESATFEQPFDIWVHDTPGSMLKIDDACRAIKDELPTRAPAVVGAVSVYECRYTDTGADAYDDHFGTNTRRVGFRLTCRR